jgi:hypothetical protein
MHCTSSDAIKQIIRDKKIKTAANVGSDENGFCLTFFSFLNDLYRTKNYENPKYLGSYEFCIALPAKKLLKKYRYYYVTHFADRADIAGHLSDRLFKIVQSVKSTVKEEQYAELEQLILTDDRMPSHVKNNFMCLNELHIWDLIGNFWHKPNPSIRDIYAKGGSDYWSEIGIFEDIDFSDMNFKIFNLSTFRELSKQEIRNLCEC